DQQLAQPPLPSVGLRYLAGRSFSIDPRTPSIFILPTAHGWNFLRSAASASVPARTAGESGREAAAGTAEQNGSWNVRKLETLAEAVPLLAATDEFVLGLPVSAVLAQRFRLPSVDPAEFVEMIRIQIEKLLPFSADEVTTDFELIEQSDTESVVSAVAIRNEQLAEIASPLLERGYIPRQITVYAAQRATTHAPNGNAVLIYPEGETLVYAVTENGKLSLARVFEGGNGAQLQLELPQLRLSAELQGIDASSPNVLLDETCYELRDTVQGILARSTEIVGIELPLAPAIDAHYYPVEILEDLFESLPSADVRITAYNQSARQISVDGEANTAALAYELIDKIKKNPELRAFQFDMAAPRILANNHAQ